MDLIKLIKIALLSTVLLGAIGESFVSAGAICTTGCGTGTGTGTGTGSGSPTASASVAICSVVDAVRGFIAILALILFIIGGTLYAVAHFMPAAGNLRGNIQGWALGMIVGGIVGIILVIVAPGIVNLIAGTSGTVVATTTC